MNNANDTGALSSFRYRDVYKTGKPLLSLRNRLNLSRIIHDREITIMSRLPISKRLICYSSNIHPMVYMIHKAFPIFTRQFLLSVRL